MGFDDGMAFGTMAGDCVGPPPGLEIAVCEPDGCFIHEAWFQCFDETSLAEMFGGEQTNYVARAIRRPPSVAMICARGARTGGVEPCSA